MRVTGEPLSSGHTKFRERPDRGETENGGHPVNGHPVERVRQGWRTLVLQAKQERAAQQVRAGAEKNCNATPGTAGKTSLTPKKVRPQAGSYGLNNRRFSDRIILLRGLGTPALSADSALGAPRLQEPVPVCASSAGIGSRWILSTRSRNSLPGLKWGTYLPDSATESPVLGLRPRRGGR